MHQRDEQPEQAPDSKPTRRPLLLSVVMLPLLFLLPIYLLFAFAMLFAVAGFSAIRLRACERRLRRRLASLGRVMEIEQLEPAATGSGGTLLVGKQLGCGGATRVWWTTDHVEVDAPPTVDGDDGSLWLARQSAVWRACEPYVQDGPRGATLIGLKPEPWESLEQRVKGIADRMNARVLEFYSGLEEFDGR